MEAHSKQTATGTAEGPATDPGASQGERLSAWLDGQLDEAAARALVLDLQQPGPSRRRFESWCVVGDALRSQEVAAMHSPRLCARIAAALENEPALLAPSALAAPVRRPAPLVRHLAGGAAIAAAAAVIVLVALPQLRSNPGAGPAQVADTRAVQKGNGAAPVELASRAAQFRSSRLDPYIQAHRDLSSGMMPAAAVYLRSGGEGEK